MCIRTHEVLSQVTEISLFMTAGAAAVVGSQEKYGARNGKQNSRQGQGNNRKHYRDGSTKRPAPTDMIAGFMAEELSE